MTGKTQHDRAYQAVIAQIMAEYDQLGDLTKAAFDQARNTALKLSASIELSTAHRVDPAKILHSTDELNMFIFLCLETM